MFVANGAALDMGAEPEGKYIIGGDELNPDPDL